MGVVEEPEAAATVIVIASIEPTAGALDAAESVVLEAAFDEQDGHDAGHAESRFAKSIEPNPEASSYPVPARYFVVADPVHRLAPAEHWLPPLVMSWNALPYVVEFDASEYKVEFREPWPVAFSFWLIKATSAAKIGASKLVPPPPVRL